MYKSFTPTIKFVAITLSIVTALGVLVHDMHIDKAATVAVGLPAIVAGVGAAEILIKSGDHTHVERTVVTKHFSPLRSSLPNVKPPQEDDHRYTAHQKVAFDGSNNHNPLWPSV